MSNYLDKTGLTYFWGKLKSYIPIAVKAFETGLGSKSSLTTSDFIRVVGSDNVSYKQPVEDVLYAGGVRYKAFQNGTAFSDFADSCNIGITFSYTRYPIQSSDSPTQTNARCAITVYKTYQDEIIISVTLFDSATENIIYEKRRYGTWGSWVKLPTRAEIDALNSNALKVAHGSGIVDVAIGAYSNYSNLIFTFPNSSVTQFVFYDTGRVAVLRKKADGTWGSETQIRPAD